MSPAKAISIEADTKPFISDKSNEDNAKENNKLQPEKLEKDVVLIYGTSASSSSFSTDDYPAPSSQSPLRIQPSIQTFTVGQDGIFPSKWIGYKGQFLSKTRASINKNTQLHSSKEYCSSVINNNDNITLVFNKYQHHQIVINSFGL